MSAKRILTHLAGPDRGHSRQKSQTAPWAVCRSSVMTPIYRQGRCWGNLGLLSGCRKDRSSWSLSRCRRSPLRYSTLRTVSLDRMVCGGYVCSRNALCALNILYCVSTTFFFWVLFLKNKQTVFSFLIAFIDTWNKIVWQSWKVMQFL